MANGAARDQCMTDMIQAALSPNVTVHQSTNASPSIDAAIKAGSYVEERTIADLHVNFDRNLTAKTGNATGWGWTQFRTPPGKKSIQIFIVLGPNALDPVGPQHTRMTLDHEKEHAWDFLKEFALIGRGPPHAATAGEELAIFAEGFSMHFLDLWTIDNAARTYQISELFSRLFTNYADGGASKAQRDTAFASIKMFFDVRVVGIPCNLMKFKIWLQMMQNARPPGDALIGRLNAFAGMGLRKGTPPITHFNAALGCS